jgi:hypothetical protein
LEVVSIWYDLGRKKGNTFLGLDIEGDGNRLGEVKGNLLGRKYVRRSRNEKEKYKENEIGRADHRGKSIKNNFLHKPYRACDQSMHFR